RLGAAPGLADRAPVPAALGRLAGHRPLGEPAAARRPRRPPVGGRRARAAAGGPSHVAVLRDVRRPRGHALPPDNFQEDPSPVVARRTSPTNMGLYLLATLAARDFGWLGTLEAVERLEATLETMQRLERFRGHFYNWYGTSD